LLLFFVTWVFLFFLLTSPMSESTSICVMQALAKSAAALSLNPSHSLAILLLRLTSVTSLEIFFYFLGAGVEVVI
jgi:hypothetical protein